MYRSIEEVIDAQINGKTLAATFAVLAVVGAKDVSDEKHICELLKEVPFVSQQADVVRYKPLNFLPARPVMCD